jgi:hypothetical protein
VNIIRAADRPALVVNSPGKKQTNTPILMPGTPYGGSGFVTRAQTYNGAPIGVGGKRHTQYWIAVQKG